MHQSKFKIKNILDTSTTTSTTTTKGFFFIPFVPHDEDIGKVA